MVTLNASHTVKPAEPIPHKVMYLSDCDQIKPVTHAPTIYFYRPTTHESLKDIVQILKDSLSKALVEFYPLAGRLSWAEGGRVELYCNSMGALLIEAESELKIDDFGDFCPTSEIRSLIPSVDYTTTPIEEVPLLLVQVTKFVCGGISLGSGMSHIVVDGQSGVHFFTEWAKIARGEESNDFPFLDRTILQLKEDQPLASPTLKDSDFFPLPFLLGQSDNLEERKKATTTVMLKLSKEQIDALRNKANQDLYSKEQIESLKGEGNQDLDNKALKDQASEDRGNLDLHRNPQDHEGFEKNANQDHGGKEKIVTHENEGNQDPYGKERIEKANQDLSAKEHSEAIKNKANQDLDQLQKTSNQPKFTRFEAVSAHIWRCASMARMLKPEQETVLFVTVDFRNRLRPPLPKRYFGNAVLPCPVSATVGELVSKPLSYAARKIREGIQNITHEYVRSYLVWIKNIPNISSYRHFHTVGCSQGSFYGNPNMIITSWIGMPLYGATFGWGDEIFLGPGSLGYDGRAFIIPSQNDDGSFLIPIRLQVEHMDAFERYFYEEIN